VRYALVTSKDITGARRAQEALRTSEERYRTAFLTSIDPIAITNFNDGTYVDVNQRLTNMLGYSREEMIGHTSLELEIWTDPQKREAIFAPLRQGEEVKEKLCRFRRKNGESFPALVSSALVTIGGAPAIHSVIRDITETTKAEQERLASEARYRAAFHTSLDAVVLMDFKTRKLLEANERFLSVMGYSQEDVVNMTPGELRMWEDDNERIRLAKELSRQGSIEEKLTRLQHKNGEAFWATISASTFVLGGRRCVLTVIRDVTEKLKAENALRESEARYRTAFQTSLDAVAINRMDNQQYVDVNNAYERLFGYTREEMLSHTSAEVNLWTDPELRARFYRMLRRDAAVHDLVFGFRRKGGQPGWGTLSASVIDLDGVQCTLVVIHDITARRKAEEVSRASENRYRAVFETSKDAISILRVGDEKLLDVNRAWCNLYGYAREEVVDKDTRGLQLWIDGEARLRTYEKIHRGEEIRDVEFRFLRKNGEQGWATATTSNIELDGTQCVMFAAHDVTEERRAKIVMRESEARYRTVFQTSHDALIITRNRDGAYVDVSQAFLNLTGWSRKEAIGNTSIGLNLWVDLDQLLLYLERGERVDNFEVRFRNKSGGIFVGLLALAPMEVAGEECCLTTIHDITAVRYAEQQIHSLSYYDPLTGLANRRMLRLKLEEEARRSAGDGRHLAILCINLDNFESIANAFGRSVGDIVLRQAGVRIGKCVTRSDLITHQEGAEFFVLLPQLDSSLDAAAGRAHTVAENIAAQIGIPAMVEGHECICSCSVGMALCTGQSAVEGDAMQRAHIAMQQSRTAGRNGICCYSSGLQEALSARAALEEDLRQGIRENQFVLYYQPQIGSGKLIGAEALLRWNHPRLGLLGPDRFIELAEESRLILPLGKWVLAEACRQITAWKQHHVLSEMKISVNISALQFYEPGFVESVFRALESANADPARLAVELTESVLLYNIEDVIAKMQTLRERGIGFSLDDFGTGYSSLSYLKRLPLSQLKIDRSFVRDIFTDSSSKAIAQAVISLSTALNVPVIAEGVETDEQRAALVRMGCTNFQGYLFGRPVASDDFESSLPQLLESALHAARKS
jgi:diguanylate cyclase (GGDEF)-like protein/PAS domain S-box-containing protein